MQLSPYQRDVIRSATAEVAGPAARVLLFGARIEMRLGEQKLDILVVDPVTSASPILDAARRDGVAL